MRRTLVSAAIAVAVLGGATTGVVALAADDPDSRPAHGHAGDHDGDHDGDHGHGQGPPAWAHSQSKAATKHDWLDAWRELTPAQREQKMTRLARAHEHGMKQWAACVEAARQDSASRDDCEKPMPPGLAKKQP